MNLTEYYSKIYRLCFIQRYTNIVRIRSEDVAQHSFFVAAIILKLYDIYDFNLGRALQAAVAHDITEADLSDITHGVKKLNPDLAKAIKLAECKAVCEYPDAVIEGYDVFESASVEGLIANLADVIQVQQYIDSEQSLGNSTVDDIDKESRVRKHKLTEELKSYVRPGKNAFS